MGGSPLRPACGALTGGALLGAAGLLLALRRRGGAPPRGRPSSEALPTHTAAAVPPPLELAALSAEVRHLLATRRPSLVEGVSSELHHLPPHIPKAVWTKLGDAIKVAERPGSDNVPGSRFITLRLDGSGFSRLVGMLQKAGIFDKGYSPEFAEIMRDCCCSLMAKYSARCGYTQSDEMTIIIPPASVVRGEQQPHLNGGRVLKICTHAAAHVTARFNYKIQLICEAKGLPMEERLLATFDCRLGHYGTLDEALSLLLWRAQDCGVNGVADAVHHCRGMLEGAKQATEQGTGDKLKWLAEKGRLPLLQHQAHGSFFVKVKRRKAGMNPKMGETTMTLRGCIEEVPGNLLCRLALGQLFPEDDKALDEVGDGPHELLAS